MIHMSEPLGNGCFHDPVNRRVSGLKAQAFWKTGNLIAHIPYLHVCACVCVFDIVHIVYRSIFLIVFRLRLN